jgi:hypothetical protein
MPPLDVSSYLEELSARVEELERRLSKLIKPGKVAHFCRPNQTGIN